MSEDVESKVYALVEDCTGVRRAKLTPESRLSFDLGMEGDDAVEFLDRYKTEFGDLGTYWDSYFSGEGVSPVILLTWAIPAILMELGFDFFLPDWPVWICWILSFTIPWCVLLAWGKLTDRPRDNKIAIRRFVEAAQIGHLKLAPIFREAEKVAT